MQDGIGKPIEDGVQACRACGSSDCAGCEEPFASGLWPDFGPYGLPNGAGRVDVPRNKISDANFSPLLRAARLMGL